MGNGREREREREERKKVFLLFEPGLRIFILHWVLQNIQPTLAKKPAGVKRQVAQSSRKASYVEALAC